MGGEGVGVGREALGMRGGGLELGKGMRAGG